VSIAGVQTIEDAGYGCPYMLVSVAYEYVRTHPQKRTQMMY